MKKHGYVLTCVGLNHLSAPVEEREKLAFSSVELPGALSAVASELGGAVLLSTCNRTELYATVPSHAEDSKRLIDLLLSQKGVEIDRSFFYTLRHKQAVTHLFRVAAGIESMVLGESQVLGQVREAMSAATEAKLLNSTLSRVFHAAIAVGKKARTETNIGRHTVSISSAAVTLARRTSGDLMGKTVLVISAGSTGKLAAKGLAQAGGAKIVVANRTLERAVEVAESLGVGASAVPFSALVEALSMADVVISGTASGDFILGVEQIAPAMSSRNGRSLLLIDIAVPRDIDPTVRDLPGVQLFDIDDVEAVTLSGIKERRREVAQVEAIIKREVDAFLRWWDSLDVIPVIAALRERAEEIRLREMERTLKRLPGLDEDSRRRIEAMTAAIVKKMLDRPIARLKDGDDAGLYVEALQDLFGVPVTAGKRGSS